MLNSDLPLGYKILAIIVLVGISPMYFMILFPSVLFYRYFRYIQTLLRNCCKSDEEIVNDQSELQEIADRSLDDTEEHQEIVDRSPNDQGESQTEIKLTDLNDKSNILECIKAANDSFVWHRKFYLLRWIISLFRFFFYIVVYSCFSFFFWRTWIINV